eukprot:403332357
MYQPILKQKDNPGTSQNTVTNNTIPTQGAQLRKQGSGPVEKKSQTNLNSNNTGSNSSSNGVNNPIIKGSTFNYEDLQKQRSRDNTPIQSQKKQQQQDVGQPNNFIIESSKNVTQFQQDDQDTISVTDSELNEQRLRPSEEVQYNNAGRDRVSIQPPVLAANFPYADQRATTTSFQVFHETQKSDQKNMGYIDDNPDHQQFDVIQEEVKDDQFTTHHFKNRDDTIQNSDFKKFNIEEDTKYSQSNGLRINNQFSGKSVEPINFQQQQQFNPQQVQNMRYQNNMNGAQRTRNTNENEPYGLTLDESSLKGSTHLFLHSQSNIGVVDNTTPNSFIQPTPDNKNMIAGQLNNLMLDQQQQLELQINLQQLQNQAHLLSFSQQQQYANDMLNQSQRANLPLQQDVYLDESQLENRPLSPTAVMQQRRLNEILKSSQTDTQSLNNSVIQDKIDEKQLNGMVDLEKNFVIIQYENILQQLNVEFQKLLLKTKDSEEQLLQKDSFIKTQSRILQDKEEQSFQLEQFNKQLSSQVQELLQEVDFMSMKINQQSQQQQFMNEEQLHISSTFREDTQHRIEKEYLESKIQQLQNKLIFTEQTERDLRDQIDVISQKLRSKEQELRMKDEEIFQMSRDNTTHQRDVQNMKDIEYQLKSEIQQINNQRLQIENEVQDLRHQITSLQIQQRQKDAENDQFIRENRNLKSTLDIQQQQYDECMIDLNSSKQHVTDMERTMIQMKSHIDKVNREHTQVQQEIDRLQAQILQGKKRENDMENHFQIEIQKLVSQNNLLKQQNSQSQYGSYSNLDENNHRSGEVSNKKKISFNDEVAYRSNSNNMSMNNTVTFKDKNDSRPLQETQNNFYSPQRNQRSSISYQQPFSPPNEYDNINLKNQHSGKQQNINQKQTVAWPFIQGSGQQNTISKNQQDSLNDSRYGNSQGRRATIQNKNESQLHNVFQWDQSSGGVHQHHLSVGSRSLERQSDLNVMQNSKSEKKFNQHLFNNTQQKPYPNQNDNSIQLRGQQNQFNNQHAPIQQQQHNQFKPQQFQDQDMQPAGKKSMNTHLSPLGRKDKNVEQQITHLQNSLCALQMDKDRAENDFRKIGQPKNKQQIEKKQELEQEVDIIAKNIQTLKQKLRELNAFQQ